MKARDPIVGWSSWMRWARSATRISLGASRVHYARSGCRFKIGRRGLLDGEEVKSLVAILWVLVLVVISSTVEAGEMKSPTANVLSRVIWLGDGRNTAQGSGTLVSFNGVDYLATAHHVYVDCGGNPAVRFRGQWNPFQWDVVAKDESLDVIVLKSRQLPTDLAERLPVLYGMPKGAIHGQTGYSLGFPGVHESATQLKTDHVPEIEGVPIPIAALVIVNLGIEAKVHYSASYINAGFSGGAIVYYVEDQEMWTIAGMIAHFPTVSRPVYDKNGKDTGNYTLQHTGLVGYVPMSAILKMIEDAVRK